MKTTLDLPDALVKQLKLRALHDGKKLKDAVADVLRAGLAAPRSKEKRPAVISTDKKTGLPVIVCNRVGRRRDLTPDDLAQILHDQEVERALESR